MFSFFPYLFTREFIANEDGNSVTSLAVAHRTFEMWEVHVRKHHKLIFRNKESKKGSVEYNLF